MSGAEPRMRHRRETEQQDDRFRLLRSRPGFEGVCLNLSCRQSEGSPRGVAGDSGLAASGMMVERAHELRSPFPAKFRSGRIHLGQ